LTPRSAALPPLPPSGVAKPTTELRVEEDEDAEDEEEAASALAFLQEALKGTPRDHCPNPQPQPTKEMLPTPLPDAIRPPAIVLQHSLHEVHEPSADLVPRYDYLSEAELAEQMRAADEIRVPECLLARRRLKGSDDEWSYLVRWQGLSEEHDMWVPGSELDPDFIEADLRAAETERQLTARAAEAE